MTMLVKDFHGNWNVCEVRCFGDEIYDIDELVESYKNCLECPESQGLTFLGDITQSEANELLSAVIFIFALAFVLRLIRNFLLNR